MNSKTLPHIFRFIGLFIAQVLVIQNIEFERGVLSYVHPMIYPLFIILLPIKTPVPLVTALGFTMGLMIDYLYSSFGMHAGAAVFVAYTRSFVLNFLEPRGGYNVSYSPNAKRYSIRWFLQYSAIMLFLHHVFYFSLQFFAPVYIVPILLNTIGSMIVSFMLVAFFQIIFDPQD